MSYLHTTVQHPLWGASVVIGETSTKKGKIVLTVRTAKGKTETMMADDGPKPMLFEPPATFAELAADYRADNKARRRLMGI